MPDDSSRAGWLRGLVGGSGKKSGDENPRNGKPLAAVAAESPATRLYTTACPRIGQVAQVFPFAFLAERWLDQAATAGP